jgi:hypothetical protein
MKYNLKSSIAALIILILVVPVSFMETPVAHAAVQQTDTSQVFTKCMENGTTIALAKKGVQIAIQVGVAALMGSAKTSAETAASAINVPTTNPAGAWWGGASTGMSTASSAWQNDVKPYFDELAYITGQCALEQVTANTISWIKGGFHGSPSFAVSPKKLYSDLKNSVANQLARQVVALKLTDFVPGFSNNLTKSLQLSASLDAQGRLKSNLQMTFPIGVQPSTFYNDFRQGGWPAYYASLSDNNNPFGNMLIVGNEMAVRNLEAQTIQKQQLDWSKGFIDIVDTDDCDYPAGGDSSDPEAAASGGIALDASGQPDQNVYTQAEITSLQRQYCNTTTPGSILSQQLDKTLGTDLDRLGFADNVDKIITALISKLVQDTVKHVF